MKKLWFRKAICLLLSVTAIFSVISFSAFAAASTSGKRGTNRDTAASLLDMQSLVGVSSYSKYLEEHGCEYLVTRGGQNIWISGDQKVESDTVQAIRPKQESDDLEVIPVQIIDGMLDGSNAQPPAINDYCQLAITGDQLASFLANAEDDSIFENSLYLPALGETTWTLEVPDGMSGTCVHEQPLPSLTTTV